MRKSLALAAAVVMSCSAYDPDYTGDGEDVGEVEQMLGAAVTVSFQNGVLPTSAYAGTTDSSIKQATATTNFGTATTLEADGDDGAGVDKSALVRWTLSGIPAGSIVQSASITLRIINETNNTYNVYELRRAWNESQVTWQNAATGTPWATAGAMGATDRGAVVGTVTGAVGTTTINLNSAGIALVQSWVNGGTNAGVVIAHATNTNGIDFASSEDATLAYRPRLNDHVPAAGFSAATAGRLDFDGVDDRVTMGQAPTLGLSPVDARGLDQAHRAPVSPPAPAPAA